MGSTLPSAVSPDTPIRRDQLELLFHSSESVRESFRIGAEAEKFGVDASTGAPLQYAGGIERIFRRLIERYGWSGEAEMHGGPVIALQRNGASITLEPGAQLELSGAPLADVHAIDREMREHLDELAGVTDDMNVVWLGVGFHPLAKLADLPWVPKQRYSVMRQYLPERGSRALDMMQRTATVQANFDYSGENDAMSKLVVLLRLSSVIHAMTANAPFIEGAISSRKSERGDVWLHMDPARSGLIASLWDKANPRYGDYVEWALDAGMFLFRRGDTFIRNTGQTFRDFLQNGFSGHRATFGDWAQHVNTLFPEVRLKKTIEVRSCDMLPLRLASAVPALLTGVLYDDRAFDQARELASTLDYASVSAARPEMVQRGLDARVGEYSVQTIAERLIEIARGGLERRNRLDASGKDERIYLDGLCDLVAHGRTPADALLSGLGAGDMRREIIERARIGG